ncbi:DOPA-like domain-containing protein [Halteromyces radiatus]|uniref:DOPA-like domain-containing protein n=1 Tax=Halteromyces radiatus TaxID=101107 RepID=UPI00221E4DB5|nr:DOPA-like domain-containing protein [Halteromyces radiatus]KAI8097630.1 DOPA-like domain-containing protein [Halteromyces radiatus]
MTGDQQTLIDTAYFAPSEPTVSIQNSKDIEEEIKEWHFHIYFFQQNEEQKQQALVLRDRVLALVKEGFFKVVPFYRVNLQPIGPHPIGSYEVWCPTEHFARAFSFFTLNRGGLSILIHPLTLYPLTDHTSRAVWLGASMPLDYSSLADVEEGPLGQYPKLKLGYSK